MHTHRRLTVVTAAVAATLTVASGLAVASETDTVRGSVVVDAAPEACIEIALDAILFGGTAGLTFTPDTGNASDNVEAEPSEPYTVTNCSDSDSELFGRATTAEEFDTKTGYWDPYDPISDFVANGGAPLNICDTGDGVDQYWISAEVPATGKGTFLTLADRQLNLDDVADTIPGSGSIDVTNRLTMPCEGSSGEADEVVQFEMVYTAVLP